MEKYTIGVDYGTLSGRALLVEVSTGRELASAVYEYPHAVMDTQLPCGKNSSMTGHCSIRRIIWMCWRKPFRPFSRRAV